MITIDRTEEIICSEIITEILAEERGSWTKEDYRVSAFGNLVLSEARARKFHRFAFKVFANPAADKRIRNATSSPEEFNNRLRQIPFGTHHPDCPMIGDIVVCTDKERCLDDPGGYRVESRGTKEGYGLPYGFFSARGVVKGRLYRFSVHEWNYKSQESDHG